MITLPILFRLSFTQQMILTVALWLSFHGRKPAEPRIMRKLWRNLIPGQSANLREQIADLREQTDNKKGKRTEDISRERRVEIQQRATAQRCYPEDATDPIVAP